MGNFCLRLHAAVREPIGHLERINEVFAPLLIVEFPNVKGIDESVVCIIGSCDQYLWCLLDSCYFTF